MLVNDANESIPWHLVYCMLYVIHKFMFNKQILHIRLPTFPYEHHLTHPSSKLPYHSQFWAGTDPHLVWDNIRALIGSVDSPN